MYIFKEKSVTRKLIQELDITCLLEYKENLLNNKGFDKIVVKDRFCHTYDNDTLMQ